MTRRPHHRALLAIPAVLALALTACSSGGSPASSPSATASSADSAAASGSPADDGAAPVLAGELTFAFWGDASRADRYQAAVDLFEADHPGVKVLTQFAGWGDYWTSRNTEAAGSALPDVFQMDLAYLAEYASTGRLLALDDAIGSSIDVSAIPESLLPSGQIDGVTYAIPTSSSTLATFVDATMLGELGVEVPQAAMTWAEYDEFLAEVTDAGAARSPSVFGSLDYSQLFWLFAIWLEQQGTSLIDDDGGIGFTREDLTAWWTRGSQLLADGTTMPMDRQYQLDADAIGVGAVGADISWSNFLVRFSEGSAAPDLTLLPVPSDDAQDRGLFLKPGLMLATAANTDQPDLAAAFTDFITNDPRVGEIFGMSRGLPASTEALAGVSRDGLDGQIIAFSEEIAPLVTHDSPVSVTGFSTMESTFVSISQDLGYGILSVEDAVDEWFAEAEAAVG